MHMVAQGAEINAGLFIHAQHHQRGIQHAIERVVTDIKRGACRIKMLQTEILRRKPEALQAQLAAQTRGIGGREGQNIGHRWRHDRHEQQEV